MKGLLERRIGPLLWAWVVLAALSSPWVPSSADADSLIVPDDFPTILAALDSMYSVRAIRETVFVRSGVEPEDLEQNTPAEVFIIGLAEPHEEMPRLGSLLITDSRDGGCGNTFIENMHIVGPVTVPNIICWPLDLVGCVLDSGLSVGREAYPVRLTRCTVNGAIVSGSIVEVDSCAVNGRIVSSDGDGHLTVRNCVLTGPGAYAILADNDHGAAISGNTIRGFDSGILLASDNTRASIRDNVIEDCRLTGIATNFDTQENVEIVGNHVRRCMTGIEINGYATVQDNVIGDCNGDGLRLFLEGGTVERNIVGNSGGHGVSVTRTGYSTVDVRNNTSFDNAGSGFVINTEPLTTGQVNLLRNIGYRNGAFGVHSTGDPDPISTCNDWFANDSGSVAGMKPSLEDLSVDPLFCDIDHDSVTLAEDSPLLNAPGCGLIGARGVGCASTPTLVSLFTAEREAEDVRVRWQLADQTRFTEVWIERADVVAGPWARVATHETTEGDVQVYVDRGALPDNEYWYRLVTREGSEVVVIAEPLRVAAKVASRFELVRVSPNPGSGPLRISFTLAHEAPVEVDVFDVQGRHLASLVRGSMAAGGHVIEWSGLAGKRAGPSELHLVRYRYPGGEQVLRSVRLR